MQKYLNSVSILTSGAAVPNASISVLNYPALTTATIYSDNVGTIAANPVSADNFGNFGFYAADGRYQLNISSPTIVTQYVVDILLQDLPGNFNTYQAAISKSDNPIINGSHSVAQAATSGTLTAGGSTTLTAYTTDMHHAWCTGANVAWAQVAGSLEFQNAIQFTGAASVTAIGHGLRIESHNVTRFKNQSYVNVSVWMSNSLLTSVGWTAYYVNATDAFGTNGSGAKTQIATGTITLSAADTTLRQYVISFAGGATIGNGVAIEFTVGAQTSGTWVITGEDMFTATTATQARSYPHLVYGDVLLKAMKYYYENGVALVGVNFSTSSIARASGTHPVPMRIPPSVTVDTNVTFYDGAISTATGTIANYSTVNILQIDVTTNAVLTAGRPSILIVGSGKITVSARL